MASNQTVNYGLNQWEPEDQVLREEFNADNAKIDAAIAARGNCCIQAGSYIGTGTTGVAGAIELTFGFKPLVLFMHASYGFSSSEHIVWTRPGARFKHPSTSEYFELTWLDNGVRWYIESAASSGTVAGYQLNTKDQEYFYIALGEPL